MTPATFDPKTNPSDETIRVGPLTIRFLLTGAESNRSVAVFELSVPGKMGLPGPAHSHDHYDETAYGLEGVLTFTVEGKRIDVGPGETFCIPRGAVHRFDNHGDQTAKAVCIITPAELGPEYFREVADLLKAAGGGPPDPAKAAEIMRRYGLTVTAAGA
jgi:quercetin dioxygenase-like cupin family protein